MCKWVDKELFDCFLSTWLRRGELFTPLSHKRVQKIVGSSSAVCDQHFESNRASGWFQVRFSLFRETFENLFFSQLRCDG
jgi:hypothetical protein